MTSVRPGSSLGHPADGPERTLNLLYVNGTSVGGSLMSTTLLARRLAERGHAITLVHERRPGGITKYIYRRATNLEVKRRNTRSADRLSRLNRRFGATCSVSLRDGVNVATCRVAENGARALLGADFDAVVVSSLSRVGWSRVLLDAADRDLPTVLYLREEALLPHLGIVGRPNLVMANSEALGVAAASHRPVVVPSIIDLPAAAVASTRRTVLLVNPTEDYGLQTATDLAVANPDIPFVLQESTPLDRVELAKASRIASDIPNVEFRRFNPRPAQVYRDARLLLAPYSGRLRSNRPRSVIEAMYNGIPVLASDLAGLREAVGPGGVLVPHTGGPGVWSEVLREVWSDGPRYESLASLATDRAREAEQGMADAVARFEAALTELVVAWRRGR